MIHAMIYDASMNIYMTEIADLNISSSMPKFHYT